MIKVKHAFLSVKFMTSVKIYVLIWRKPLLLQRQRILHDMIRSCSLYHWNELHLLPSYQFWVGSGFTNSHRYSLVLKRELFFQMKKLY